MAAAKYFLIVDGVNGGSSVKGYEGAFEISAYDLDIAHLVNLAGGGGSTATLPAFDPLALTLPLGSGLTDLLAAVAASRHIRSVKIEGVTDSADPQTVFELKLGDVTISQLSEVSGADDQLDFSYNQISVTTWAQEPEGALRPPSTFSYDLVTHQTETNIPEPVAPAAAGSVPQATKFFLLIDGVNGGSLDKDHQGWFEISSYDLDIAGILAQTGSDGRAVFDPLDVTLRLDGGLTSLLSKLAGGQHVRSIKLDGVAGGASPQTVFSLKLGDVVITHAGAVEGGDDQLTLFYSQISVTTSPQQANGAPGVPATFS
ncbi:type VI secretion system tube protein Hcp [Chelatococcus reniformis]|uniref:Type VI secretion system tube protein Hcp n=1 Tax=Chelatococcus reniformis TaxID=1494448 RepID=A0A916XB28_9HYPH|nr:type VI secretion system tube protein Hcp [Chelatococcus reniformis]GGC60301.1 hypothetical protein GCM10010994_18690 [Chelatococcus reniformis]